MTRQTARVAYLSAREARIVANELEALGFTYSVSELETMGYVGNLTDNLRRQGEAEAAGLIEDMFDPESADYIRQHPGV